MSKLTELQAHLKTLEEINITETKAILDQIEKIYPKSVLSAELKLDSIFPKELALDLFKSRHDKVNIDRVNAHKPYFIGVLMKENQNGSKKYSVVNLDDDKGVVIELLNIIIRENEQLVDA